MTHRHKNGSIRDFSSEKNEGWKNRKLSYRYRVILLKEPALNFPYCLVLPVYPK